MYMYIMYIYTHLYLNMMCHFTWTVEFDMIWHYHIQLDMAPMVTNVSFVDAYFEPKSSCSSHLNYPPHSQNSVLSNHHIC